VIKIITGKPYRPNKPTGFRYIHKVLHESHVNKRQITLKILENAEPGEEQNRRERELIKERGTLNGPAKKS
jgi:hypothetical protein